MYICTYVLMSLCQLVGSLHAGIRTYMHTCREVVDIASVCNRVCKMVATSGLQTLNFEPTFGG